MELYFIRHGQSENNVLENDPDSKRQRKVDPLLTTIGQRQAKMLAQFLGQFGNRTAPGNAPFNDTNNREGFGFTHLYCSLQQRAIQTATPIAAALDLPLVAWQTIHEHWGLYLESESGEYQPVSGPGRSFFAREYPHLQLPPELDESGWWKYGRAEDDEAKLARAHQFIQELQARHGNSDDRVAIVSHGGFFVSLIRAWLGIAPGINENWFLMNNCGLTRFSISKRGVLICYQNRLDYLPQELITG